MDRFELQTLFMHIYGRRSTNLPSPYARALGPWRIRISIAEGRLFRPIYEWSQGLCRSAKR